MACENCNEDVSRVLRRYNKALRTVNRKLRRSVLTLQDGKDEVFLALCATDKTAESAFGELWARGDFTNCGPQDYDVIVECCIAAFEVCREVTRIPSSLMPAINENSCA
jgi:hypothetical protein